MTYVLTGGAMRQGGEFLADLLDRPTCRVVEFERARWTGEGGEVRRIVEHRCSACDAEPWADAESVTRFCPMCGAEVCGG